MRAALSLLLPFAFPGCAAPETPPDADTEGPPTLHLPGEGALAPSLTDRFARVLAEEAAGLPTPGAVAAVVLPGGAWVGAWGVRSVDTGEPTTEDLAFRAGSISKTQIASAILQRVDTGELALESTVDRWYPDVPQADAISLRDLLAHTSGIPNYTEIGEFYSALTEDDPEDPGIDTIIGWSADDSPEFEAGTAYSYSNTNYFILGRILEREAGAPLDTVLGEAVWEPQGLRHSWIDGYGSPAAPTEVAGGHLNGLPDRPLSPDWRWASGGLNADVRDLARWSAALVEGDAVPADQREAMRTPSAQSVEAGSPYGLGLRVRQLSCGHALGHTGSTMGFQADMFHTDRGVTVVVLVNDFFAEASTIAYALCDVAAEALE